MKKLTITQAIMLTVGGLAIIVAVIMFSFYRGSSSQNEYSEVIIWGILSENTFKQLLEPEFIGEDAPDYSHIIYVQKDPDTFEEEFVSALAEGRGPDLIILRENQLIENKNRLVLIPYESYNPRQFQEVFVESANMLALDGGYAGVPILIDPLVLYYNKDILNSNGISRPPQNWTEVLSLVPKLTDVNTSFEVSKNAIALGNFDNINNAKEIIWTLIMQSGNNVIQIDDRQSADENSFISVLGGSPDSSILSAKPAIDFYTQFSNPNKVIYSWNRSMPSSQDFFLAGNSAFYIGFASELPILQSKNPNLNFDVADIPQAKSASKKTTYGKMYFVAITRGVRDLNASFDTTGILANSETQEKLSQITGLPSVRRDLIGKFNSTNSFEPVFHRSALFSYGVPEPNANTAGSILSDMIKKIVSGELETSEAITRASKQFANELEN